MNNLKLTSFQKILSQNFATKAKIKFLGKRSLLVNNNNLNNQSNKSYSNDVNS